MAVLHHVKMAVYDMLMAVAANVTRHLARFRCYTISELKCSMNRKNRRDRNVPPIGDRLDIPV